MRRAKLMTAAITLSVPLLPIAEASADTGRVESHIPTQDLKEALKAFVSARGIKLHYTMDQVKGLKTVGVDGNLTVQEELGTLLAGTGLTFQFTGENTVTLVPTASARVSAKAAGTALGGGAGDEAEAAPMPSRANPQVLEEVIVTAQKRSEQLLDVPVPVTVLEGADLAAKNQLRIQDYYSQVPGLQYSTSPNLGGLPFIAIRGIVAGSGLTPTVEPTIDGVSFGSSTGFGGGFIVPDFDPSDLARIEVLKGPQGTLYGANSLGGLLQYVTIDPSVDGVSGRVQAGASTVENGANAGFNARAAVNIPLSDTVAVRASGFVRRQPGYVDDPTYGEEGVNRLDTAGGHLAVMYQPSDSFSVKFSALFQRDAQFGAPYVDSPNVYPNPAVPVSGSDPSSALQQNRLPDTGRQDRTLQAYILTLDAKFDPLGHAIDLTSISSYSRNKIFESLDASITSTGTPSPFPILFGLMPGAPGVGVISTGTDTTEKVTEELRLSTGLGSHVDWLLGAFFTHENSGYSAGSNDGVYVTQVGGPSILALTGPITSGYKEYAVFTDFTFKVTDRFDVQVGGRASKSEVDLTQVTGGPLSVLVGAPPGGVLVQKGSSSDTAATYLFTPRYKLIDDASEKVMVYARLASGFRPGGVNVVTDSAAQLLPGSFGADRTMNYDLGIKADLLDHTLFVDFSAFYIDWKNIQLSAAGALDPATGLQNSGFINGARARSDGAELSTEWHPLQGLSITANATFTDAVLTHSLPPLAAASTIADSGDRLPLSAKFVGNLGANYEFPIYNQTRGFVGAQYSYVGGREGLFQAATLPFRQYYGAYGVGNVQLGAKWNTWTAELYGTNVTDRRGVLGGGISETPPYSFIYITPRTIGIELSTVF